MPRDGSGVYTKPHPNVVTETTIESAVYNGFVGDIETDNNAPRPIIAGGTGGVNAIQARANLQAEVASQTVTNYDSHVWEAGSFWSGTGATAAPTGNIFTGICTPVGGNPAHIVIEARDNSTGINYYRIKYAGTWGAWISEGRGDADYVNVTGDTMTGGLVAPTANFTTSITAPTANFTTSVTAPTANFTTSMTAPTANFTTSMTTPTAYLGSVNNVITNDGTNIILRTNGSVYVQTIATLAAPVFCSNLTADGSVTASNILMNGSTGTVMAETAAYNFVAKATSSGANYALYSNANTVRGNLGWNSTSGDVSLINYPNGHSLTLRGSDTYFICSHGAAKPGGGTWIDSSDARIKNILGNYDNGLDAILQLQPVRYTFKGNDTYGEPPSNVRKDAPPDAIVSKDAPVIPYPNSTHEPQATAGTEFIGLVAQDSEGVMPELVTHTNGYIDGQPVTDLRMLDAGPLVFALINAVKTLTARIEALEAAQL